MVRAREGGREGDKGEEEEVVERKDKTRRRRIEGKNITDTEEGCWLMLLQSQGSEGVCVCGGGRVIRALVSASLRPLEVRMFLPSEVIFAGLYIHEGT